MLHRTSIETVGYIRLSLGIKYSFETRGIHILKPHDILYHCKVHV